eukprot:GHVT01072774.1.p1 GENE.GHVT01072774.1~~GHVT01072774.1.p1  ORF type:complete len:264 (-),score=61.97 GHVT01072774.1:719-1510(-)
MVDPSVSLPVSPSNSLPVSSSDSSAVSSPDFARAHGSTPEIRDADLKAVARNAKKKSRSAPPSSANYLVPLAAVLFVGCAALTQIGKPWLLRGGSKHVAALHLHSIVALKSTGLPALDAPPAVGAPLALPSPPAVGAVAAVDAPPPSLAVALRAPAAEQPPVATDGLTPAVWAKCLALLWRGGKKKAGGFVQTRLKRRLAFSTDVETLADCISKGANAGGMLNKKPFQSPVVLINIYLYRQAAYGVGTKMLMIMWNRGPPVII